MRERKTASLQVIVDFDTHVNGGVPKAAGTRAFGMPVRGRVMQGNAQYNE